MAKRTTLSLEEIAAEVGRLFGTTEAHARRWLDQRGRLLEALHLVRDRAHDLITEIGGEVQARRRGRSGGSSSVEIPVGSGAEAKQRRKTRRVSAATRAKMRAAAKKRWAERKKATTD